MRTPTQVFSYKTTFRLLSVATLLAAAWGQAAAQGGTYARLAPLSSLNDTHGGCANRKLSDYSYSQPAAVSIACAWDNVTWTAAASNAGGFVRASSSASSVGGASRPELTGNWPGAYSRALWQDMLIFQPGTPPPASVLFTFLLTGYLDLAGNPAGELPGDGWAYASVGFQIQSGGPTANYSNQLYAHGRPDTYPQRTASANVREVIQVRAPVTIPWWSGGAPYVAFSYELVTSANFHAGASYRSGVTYPTSLAGHAISDFSNTGKLTGLDFFDATGAQITTPVAYTMQNGTQIAAMVAPEPSMVVLFGAGLFRLGAVARRRRLADTSKRRGVMCRVTSESIEVTAGSSTRPVTHANVTGPAS